MPQTKPAAFFCGLVFYFKSAESNNLLLAAFCAGRPGAFTD